MSTTTKPSEAEEEYFAKLDFEKKKKSAEKKKEVMEKADLEQLKEAHAMHCAGCGFELSPIVFKGFSIAKCFHCGGVFLSRETFQRLCGEDNHFLNQILEIFQFKK